VVRARFKPVTPDQRLRDLTKEFRGFEREEPGPERAERLASFVRSAHEHRQLNMAMHAAQLCLDDDPDAPDLLVRAYLGVDEPTEDRLRSLQDLRDLARYVGRDDIDRLADDELLRTARSWLADATEAERRHRLRTLASVLPRERVDDLRDELADGP
jgi:hypothetical protein